MIVIPGTENRKKAMPVKTCSEFCRIYYFIARRYVAWYMLASCVGVCMCAFQGRGENRNGTERSVFHPFR